MRAREDLGATSSWFLMIVALVAGALVVVPFALSGREEANHDREAIAQWEKAKDIRAQARLQTAARGASAYLAENATLTGFDPEQASLFDPIHERRPNRECGQHPRRDPDERRPGDLHRLRVSVRRGDRGRGPLRKGERGHRWRLHGRLVAFSGPRSFVVVASSPRGGSP
jgi:hypothetical protein